MINYKIAVLKGDGIGPEVVNEAIKVLDKISKKYIFGFIYQEALIGGAAIDDEGTPLPKKTLEICETSDAALLGAVGGPKWDHMPSNLRPEAGLLGIRKKLNLFASLRPIKIYDELKNVSPLKTEILEENIDMLIVRELNGGIYFDKKGILENGEKTSAYDTEIYNKIEINRICNIAFKQAIKREKRLCSVDKSGVLKTSRLWRETITELSKNYPEVELSHMNVDHCAMQLIKNPKMFDVIVTSNLFGDILSDEAAILTGSIGMVPSACFGYSKFGLYEPIHGTAPNISGLNISNPLATILSAALMLRYSLDQIEAAENIEKAVNEVLKTARTQDIHEGGYKKVSCSELGDLVCEFI